MVTKTPFLPDLIRDYLNTEFSERALRTIQNHTVYLNEFEKFVRSKPINPTTYQAWIKECFRRWAPQTAKCLALAATSRFLNYLERIGTINVSPHRVTKAPIVKKPEVRDPITLQEYESLKAAALKAGDASMHWAIVCGWETGMAIGDVASLVWSDVDLDQKVIVIYRLKTHERCIIPLREDSDCLQMLRSKSESQSQDWPNKPAENVFYVDSTLMILYLRGSGSIQGRFANIRAKAGVDKSKSFHNLRAAFCSMLANGGIQTALACSMTGHKSPTIFASYVTPNIERLQEQVQMARDKQGACLTKVPSLTQVK